MEKSKELFDNKHKTGSINMTQQYNEYFDNDLMNKKLPEKEIYTNLVKIGKRQFGESVINDVLENAD